MMPRFALYSERHGCMPWMRPFCAFSDPPEKLRQFRWYSSNGRFRTVTNPWRKA